LSNKLSLALTEAQLANERADREIAMTTHLNERLAIVVLLKFNFV
jgi:hypothetical protein